MIAIARKVVDSFAGGGGAGTGIRWAIGRDADIAINHCDKALEMYGANHPGAVCQREDVFKSDLRAAVDDHEVALLWASPDCRHFSRAKGSKPVSKRVRALAWVVVKWADQVGPRVIVLENVREFADWGPIVPAWRCGDCKWRGTEGQAVLLRRRRRCPRCDSMSLAETTELIPDPAKKGLTFKRWLGRLRNLGYAIEWRNLNAADFGAPTHRRRLFLVARCDGQPIVWPEPTHFDPKEVKRQPLLKLRPWRMAAECIDWDLPCPSIFARKKPLVEATMHRIAMGIKRYVLENPRPFLVGCGGPRYAAKPRPVDQPFGSIIGENHTAIVTPYFVPVTHSGKRRPHGTDEPMPTVTTAHRGELAFVAPLMLRYNSEKSPGDTRSKCASEPLGTVTVENRFSLVAAFLVKHFGGVVGVPIDDPAPTITATPTQNQIVAANLIHLNHGDKQWSGLDDPMRTLTTGKHAALVYSFLVKYFGTAIGQHMTEPLHTLTGRDRFGLVTVTIGGERWAIVDIGMRMLSPRELARAQGFPDDYVLTGSKTSQAARIGNSVPPVMAKVLVEANCGAYFPQISAQEND